MAQGSFQFTAPAKQVREQINLHAATNPNARNAAAAVFELLDFDSIIDNDVSVSVSFNEGSATVSVRAQGATKQYDPEPVAQQPDPATAAVRMRETGLDPGAENFDADARRGG